MNTRRHPWPLASRACLLGLGSLLSGLLLLAALLTVLGALATLLVPLAGIPGSLTSTNEPVLSVTHAWPGPQNPAVVQAGLYVAAGLYNGPPDGLDTWYRPAHIPAALAYWRHTCAGCAAWAQGNLQCVMLLTAAYGLAGQPLPYVGNAVTFWTSGAYARQPGWSMLPPVALPYPGDMLVLSSPYFGGVGHIALIVDVRPPTGPGVVGSIQFVQANGPGPLNRFPLWENLAGQFTMGIWQHYTVLGYIRHTAALVAAWRP
ncbi:MAG TPA: hypothetical protein VGF67_04670 [Ktedonobacteraceae bacterium]|jgi:hypothetical protein